LFGIGSVDTADPWLHEPLEQFAAQAPHRK
jgi:hypothetical protein